MPDYLTLTDDDYLQRIKSMDRWLVKVRDSDRDACYRYLDLNMQATGAEYDDTDSTDYQEEADVPDFVPIGQTNYITINNEIKMAAVAMGTPLMYVKANEDPQNGGVPNAGEIVANAWQQSWENGNWGREFCAALQKRGIIGLGMIAYRWDTNYGPCYEHVPYKRLLLCPNATNLLRLPYGGYILYKTVRDAMALYDPEGTENYFQAAYTGMNENANLDKKLVKIYVYYDRKTEVHAHDDKVIHKEENLYREIPLLPNEGYIDPRDKLLPLGDNVHAQGLNVALSDLHTMALNTAKHGQQITIGDKKFFDTQTQQSLEQGKQQQIIFGKTGINPQALPLFRLPAEQLSQAWEATVGIIRMALDGIMGTTPGQRGEQMPNVTATQSVMVENRAGARPTQERAEYEMWITRAMRSYVSMMVKFGGPTAEDPGTAETQEIWKAFKSVYDVRMVDGSASFEPPAADKQSAMQSYTTMVQSMPMWLQLRAAGMTDEMPNMKQWADDVVMAFKKQNKEQYWIPAPPQQNDGPDPELIKALSVIYKDSPPDVQGQIQQDFGLQASELAGDSEDGQVQAENLKSAVEQDHELRMQQEDHQHEAAMETIKQKHEKQLKWWDIAGKIKQAQMKPKPTAKPAAKPKAKK